MNDLDHTFRLYHNAVCDYYSWYYKDKSNASRVYDASEIPASIIKPINQYGLEVLQYLIIEVSNKREKFSTGSFEPYIIFGGNREILGKTTGIEMSMGFVIEGHQLELHLNSFWLLRTMDMQFFQHLSDIAKDCKLTYQSNSGAGQEHLNKFKLAYKKGNNPVFELMRDIVFLTEYDKFNRPSIIVEFKNIDHFIQNGVNAFTSLYSAGYLLYRKNYLIAKAKSRTLKSDRL